MNKKSITCFLLLANAVFILCACGNNNQTGSGEKEKSSQAERSSRQVQERAGGEDSFVEESAQETVENGTKPGGNAMAGKQFTEKTRVSEVINDAAFEGFGKLLFPVDRDVHGDMTLREASSSDVYVWYSEIHPEKTVEILNYLKGQALSGEQIFYPIYSEEEMKAESSKRDTGLFFFRGEPGKEFAIMNAGGGFMYVGAMHDSFPHALEVSKKGYNAFALIYRPDDPYVDLAQAIRFIEGHADELGVSRENYSLWGGSAGARMAAVLGNASYLGQYTDGKAVPQAAAVIMQYTGYTDAQKDDAPTYACVGTRDSIAGVRTMERRLEKLKDYGIATEFHSYKGLDHGFGIGTDTVAEGWVQDAVSFWEAQMK